jgi:hypothetical protein
MVVAFGARPAGGDERMLRSRWFPIWLSLVLGLGLAACGDTWQGMKKDTGENLEAVGGSMERAGEDVQEDAEKKEPAQ